MSSWIEYPKDHHFPIHNIPFTAFVQEDGKGRCASRIGDFIIDLFELASAGVFNAECTAALKEEKLNAFMGLGRPNWRHVREVLQKLFSKDDQTVQGNAALKAKVLKAVGSVQLVLPAEIGDYTDFYSSREHATNVGKMFRPTAAPLLPNWLHLPVGYHGRSSSIVPSGTPLRRPLGQTRPDDEKPPVFGACKLLDMELEVGAWVGTGNKLGEPVPLSEAKDTVFGLSVFNDWSARDIQKWEYVPLGPFLAKSFCSTVSPYIITLDALEPFRCAGPVQGPAGGKGDPELLPYLKQEYEGAYDLKLSAELKPKGEDVYHTICQTNFKYMYWSVFQQLAHHTVNGCNMKPGDLFASGTISGEDQNSFGSMLELTWRGAKPLTLPSGAERKFFADGDSVNLTGVCSVCFDTPAHSPSPHSHNKPHHHQQQNGDITIGFGPCEGTVLPAPKYE